MIYYYVDSHNPQSHVFDIRMVIENPQPTGQILTLPNWIPGSYLIRDFAKHIINIEAFSGDEKSPTKINIRKINSNTWQCDKADGTLRLAYRVYAFDPSVRGAHLDDGHAFFNGSCLFLKANDHENAPCQVHIAPPNCETASKWRVATSLPLHDAKEWGYGWYQASHYDELIDHPVEMGQFEIQTFNVRNCPHYIVVSGKQNADLSRLANDVQKICQTQTDMFNEPLPFKRYVFLLNVQKEGYGGLEHRSSCALLTQRDCLPIKGDTSFNRNYINLLGLFSHEYFHLWNVKRIKPQIFLPYNLNDKAYTEQLWFFEGVTSYYDELALVRAKLISPEQYLDLLAQSITKLMRNPGRKKQTISEASFDAWIKFYQPNENSPNAMVSYYLKGSLIALAIDLILRNKVGSFTLDDLMRKLWREYGTKSKGVPEGEIENILKELGQGHLSTFIHNALHTTEELPLQDIFSHFGIVLSLREQMGLDDMGGKKSITNGALKSGFFGWSYCKTQTRIFVTNVLENSPSQRAGISVQDEIVAINGIRTDSDTIERVLKPLKAGDTVLIHFFRQDNLQETRVTLSELPLDTVELSVKSDINDAQKGLLNDWLS